METSIFKWKWVFPLVVILFFSSCAREVEIDDCIDGKVYGFWMGIWHGMISLFTMFISIFNPDVKMYGVNNSGTWYDLGFLLGCLTFYGGGSRVSQGKSTFFLNRGKIDIEP